MITVYGNDLSAYSNKVKLAANALGIEYEFKSLNIPEGETRTPEYLAIHPAGKVPGLKDGDLSLFESSTIIKYLADKQGSDLYPKDLEKRAIVDQWIDFSTIHVGNAMGKVLFNRVFAAVMDVPVDEQSLSDGIKFYERFLPIVDEQLGKNKYLAGDSLSLADITLLAILDPSEVAGLDVTPYANVVKWRNTLKQESFYTKSFTEYGDILKAVMPA